MAARVNNFRQWLRDNVSQNARATVRGIATGIGYADENQFDWGDPHNGVRGNEIADNTQQIDQVTDPNANLFAQMLANQQQSGGGTGGGGVAYAPEYVFGPDGRVYDLNNPAQANAYYGMIQSQQEGDEARFYEDKLRGINEDTRMLDENAAEAGLGYERQLKELFEGKQLGDSRRQNYFAQLSPNAYQSSEGSSAQYANTLYDEGRGDINTAVDQTLGPGFLTTGQLGADSQFGRQRGQLRQEGDSVTQSYQQRIAEIRNQIAGLKARGQAFTGSFGTGPQARQAYQPTQAQQVDTSRFQPFLQFQQQSAPDANLFQQFVRPQTTGSSVGDYLGYQKPKEEKKPVNSYLYQ